MPADAACAKTAVDEKISLRPDTRTDDVRPYPPYRSDLNPVEVVTIRCNILPRQAGGHFIAAIWGPLGSLSRISAGGANHPRDVDTPDASWLRLPPVLVVRKGAA